MTAALGAAAVAALVLAAVAALLLRPGTRGLVWAAVVLVCAAVVTTVLGTATGTLDAPVALSLASGSAPVGVALAAAGRAVHVHRVTALVTAALWGGVLVPLALVAPLVIVRLCPPTACVVSDFGGALPYVVGLGGLLLVPASVVRPPDLPRSAAAPAGVRLGLTLAGWAAFAVWLAALEGAVDAYTSLLATAAVLSPAAGAVGWLVVDRIRGVDATVGRALRLGLLAGAGGILAPAADVTTAWAPVIGLVCGVAGALTHDARGLVRARTAVRAAVTALVVGAIGMVSSGIVGSAIGFVFAARFDVVGSQLLAVILTLAVAVVLSTPLTILAARRR